MNKIMTQIEDVYIIKNFRAEDNRGSFTKIYNEQQFNEMNLPFDIKESFYSVSDKNVIRGLHFQIPPFEHNKIITVIKGSVQDIVVDLRRNSKTYGKHISINVSEHDNIAIYIPKGCAHGFKSLEDNTIMLYMVSTIYNKECDSGIRWNSINYDWNVKKPIVSEKDNNLVKLEDFDSPFFK